MTTGSQFAQYINPLLAVLKDLGGSARSAEAKAAVAEHLQLSTPEDHRSRLLTLRH